MSSTEDVLLRNNLILIQLCSNNLQGEKIFEIKRFIFKKIIFYDIK